MSATAAESAAATQEAKTTEVNAIATVLAAATIHETKRKPLEYTVGLKIPNKTFEGKDVNPVHMTLAFLGHVSETQLTEVKTQLASIAGVVKVRFTDVWDTFGSEEMIKAGKGIRVRRCDIVDPEVKKAFLTFYTTFGVAEPGMSSKHATPNYHVSERTFGAVKDELATLIEVDCSQFFIKPLGPHDPVFSVVGQPKSSMETQTITVTSSTVGTQSMTAEN